MEKLHLIVGLGNPGKGYTQTRHNAGFMAVDRFAEKSRAAWKNETGFRAQLARVEVAGCPACLCKPQTYMNESGVAVQAVMAFYKAAPGQVLIAVDDADLPLGTIRLRGEGSSGGHHGLESVEQHLGTRQYARVRIGIGRRADGVREITNHVLGRFDSAELPLLKAVLDRVVGLLECWLTRGLAPAMNQFNGSINTPVTKES